jgi:hypothetical protein
LLWPVGLLGIGAVGFGFSLGRRHRARALQSSHRDSEGAGLAGGARAPLPSSIPAALLRSSADSTGATPRRPRHTARLDLEVSEGWASSFSPGLRGGDALLLSTAAGRPKPCRVGVRPSCTPLSRTGRLRGDGARGLAGTPTPASQNHNAITQRPTSLEVRFPHFRPLPAVSTCGIWRCCSLLRNRRRSGLR